MSYCTAFTAARFPTRPDLAPLAAAWRETCLRSRLFENDRALDGSFACCGLGLLFRLDDRDRLLGDNRAFYGSLGGRCLGLLLRFGDRLSNRRGLSRSRFRGRCFSLGRLSFRLRLNWFGGRSCCAGKLLALDSFVHDYGQIAAGCVEHGDQTLCRGANEEEQLCVQLF